MRENQKLECEMAEMLEIIEKAREIYANDITDHTENEYICEGLLDAGYHKQVDDASSATTNNEGKWEKRVFIIFDSEKVGYKCSECNTTWDTPTHYCPNCGAKMKGGAE